MGTSGKVNNCGLCSCQLIWKDLPGPVPLTQTEQISAGLERDPRVPFFLLLFLLSFYFLSASKACPAEMCRFVDCDKNGLCDTAEGRGGSLQFFQSGGRRGVWAGEREGDLRVLCKVWTLIHHLNTTAKGSLFISKQQGFILFYFILFSGRPFRSW